MLKSSVGFSVLPIVNYTGRKQTLRAYALEWLLDCAHIFCYNEIDIHVGMNEIRVDASPNSSLDSHQTVLLNQSKFLFRKSTNFVCVPCNAA